MAEKGFVRVLGGGGVGEATLLQKGPSPTKHRKELQTPTKHPQYQLKRYSNHSALMRVGRQTREGRPDGRPSRSGNQEILNQSILTLKKCKCSNAVRKYSAPQRGVDSA